MMWKILLYVCITIFEYGTRKTVYNIFKHILYSSENRLDLLWFFVNICHLKKIEIDKYLVYSIPSHLGLGQCNGGTFS